MKRVIRIERNLKKSSKDLIQNLRNFSQDFSHFPSIILFHHLSFYFTLFELSKPRIFSWFSARWAVPINGAWRLPHDDLFIAFLTSYLHLHRVHRYDLLWLLFLMFVDVVKDYFSKFIFPFISIMFIIFPFQFKLYF